MTMREIDHHLVSVVHYEHFRPDVESSDAVYGFTYSREIRDVCAGMLTPHTVTPVDKTTLEQAVKKYVARRSINPEDEKRIRSWLNSMPDELAIIEMER